MPVLPRGRPVCPLGGGGHHPPHVGREGPWPRRLPRTRPRLHRRRERGVPEVEAGTAPGPEEMEG